MPLVSDLLSIDGAALGGERASGFHAHAAIVSDQHSAAAAAAPDHARGSRGSSRTRASIFLLIHRDCGLSVASLHFDYE